jgi:formylglycine-generating enzyme required for sulfatase activity/mRNA-degrading endonuclease HigB of HigAB toxin-antitoxin module
MQSSLAVQSLEPRLALAVGIGADVSEATLLQTDVTAPEIRSVVAPKAGVYGEGRRLAFRVNFTEPVIATGMPTLPLTIGDTVRQAVWNGKGSGSKSLVFTAVVQAGDFAPTGVQVAGPIAFPDGATIRDKAGNDLTPFASRAIANCRVDAVGPSMTEFGPMATIAGKRVSLQVTFAEPVVVRGKPTIPFLLDGVPKQLVYARGSGRNVLTFRYKATKQETPTVDNMVFPAQAISLGSSRIIDRVRNAAVSLAAPTDVDLSVASVAENASPGAVVGVLSTVDGDGDRDRHTYTLVSGPSDADNASFSISGNQVRLMTSLDFETKSSYSLLVRSTDHGGLFTETGFTLLFNNTNEAPTDIALSATSIAENAGANTVVGTLSTVDPDAGNTFTYTLVAGTGDTDNAAFNISGNQLRATASLDFETKSSYSVRVRSTDQGGLSTEKQFTITVTDINEAPTDIALSATSIAENAGANAVVGTLSTTGPDAGGAFTYTLVAGVGDTDNAAFNISGSQLRATASLDFETKSSYSVRVRSADQGGLFTEKQFTLTVTNVNEAPTGVSLTNTTTTIAENTSTASRIKVADIVVTDDASGTNTVTLTGTDSGSFEVDGFALFLKSGVVLDFETKQSYAVTVNVADSSLAGSTLVTTAFTLTVTDVNEAPTDIALSGTSIAENAGANAVVGTLSTTDPDAGNTFTYTLVSGTGDTDNAAFNISGSQLRATASLDFETKSSYSVRVRSTDQGGLFTEKQFTITVTDIVEMAFVTVGDIGNSADTNTGSLYGDVNYQYRIGTYEVTIGQYTAFLNAVAADDPYGLYSTSMQTNLSIAGISRSGSSGSYTYSVIAPAGVTPVGADSAADRPITYVSWFDAARFANWMHNGQGSGSTETGAYTISTGVITHASRTNNVNTYTLSAPSTLSVGDQVRVTGLGGTGFNTAGIVTSVSGSQFTMTYTDSDATGTGTGSFTGASPTALAGALYRLPTENEWYKAAYYKGGSTNAGYWVYATRSDTAPGNTIGDGLNQANYYAGDYAVTQSPSSSSSQNYLTNVGAFTNSGSYYGTFDQNGNVREWSEVIVSGSSRGLRGGRWPGLASGLSSSGRFTNAPSDEIGSSGFRLASPVADPTNQAPTNITLSGTSIAENAGANAVVGTLSTVDPDAGNTFTYTLVSGTDSTDNASFNISGNQLRASASLDFETQSSYSVRVRAFDQGGLFNGLSFEKAFTITVTDVNDNSPVFTGDSSSAVEENAPLTTVIYTAATTDADGTLANRLVTYSIKQDVADADLVKINPVNGEVTLKAPADYEAKTGYAFTIVATNVGTDATLVTEQSILVSVLDLPDTGTLCRPPLRRSTTIRLCGSGMGPSPISFQYTDLAGAVTTPQTGVRFLITNVVNGTVEKWDGVRWVNLSGPITSGNPLEVLRQMAFRLISENDVVQWTPPPNPGRSVNAFRILGWDGQNRSDCFSDVDFSAE